MVLKIGALHPKLSPSLALESAVIVISTGLVGDYRTAGGSTPTTWSVTHAEALIERATFRHIRGGDARYVVMFPGVTGLLRWKVG